MAAKDDDSPGTRSGIDNLSIPAIDDDCKDLLSPLEREMYEEWRAELAEWAHERGKDPKFGDGYSASVVKTRVHRIDDFAAWVWRNYNDGFTTNFEKEQADAYWERVLLPNDNKLSSNRKRANAISLIFSKKGYENDDYDGDWTMPDSESVYRKINQDDGTNFTDWLSIDELESIKSAALRVYAVPDRDEMSADEADEWASHLSQRLRKPKHELGEDDWDRANSYKIPSLVYTSCDVGFRPSEVERARVSWLNLDDGFISIPKSESTKNSDNWRCYLSKDTIRLLRRWLDEREEISKYDDTDALWLTREGNPYSSESLRRPVMQNLMDEAGINRDERETGWYMIRRGVGTDLGTQRGLNDVMAQLRIKRVETAKRYVRHDERGVRDWLKTR